MSYFSEMENTKWDWENFLSFGSKSAIESPNKLQVTDWMIVDKGEVNVGSFNVNTGASGSDGGHVSSSKSSVSASTDCSAKDGVQTSNFRLMSFEGFSRNFSKHREMKRTEVSQTSLSLDAAVGSVEPFIGLNLGKRTFFENSGGGGNVKGKSLSSMPTQSSTTSSKKPKSSGQKSPIPCCLVEGCNIDLSSAKEYHRKHKVCESHSKCPKVIVRGLERRFCQQCSRFHNLSEFDEKKRSCRRRLSDHNARRRKPQQETSQYNSRISSPFYGGSQSFLLNNSSKIHSRTPASSTWDSKCNPRFTVTKGYSLKSKAEGHGDEQLHMPEIKLPHAIDMHGNSANGLVAFRSSTPEVFSPGSKRSQMSPSQIDTAPEYRRALSLLSSNSNSSSTWVSSCGPESSVIPLQHHHQHPLPLPLPLPLHEGTVTHAALIPEGVSLSSTSSSDFNWLSEHHHHHHYSVHPRVQSSPLASTANFQEMQLLKTPYEPAVDFYFNILN